jgi:hypothetical protein
LQQTLAQNEKARTGADFASMLVYQNQKVNWSSYANGNGTLGDERSIAKTLLAEESG